MLFFSISMHERGLQLDSTKNDFHPTNALSTTTYYSSIPYGHVPIEAWLFCGILSVADVLSVPIARSFALLRRRLMIRLVMRPLTIHRLCSVFAVLNGCCLASLLWSLSSFGVVFGGLSYPFVFFYIPGLVHTLLQSNNTEWHTLNRSAVCL